MMMSFLTKGMIKPIRLAKLNDASNILESFREMQRGSHIGKIVISLRDKNNNLLLDNIATASKTALALNPTGTYFLVGGLGGLGQSIAAWMVQHGARHLTFLSRSAGTEQDHKFVKMLESMGCAAQVVRGSVDNAEDVKRAMDEVSLPIKGIIHMGMVLRDQAFPRMTIDDWRGATDPKIAGARNLHQASLDRKLDLDFFILFSSLSGILGQPGQANYAAANTYLDALAQCRESLGLPCTALDIGAMEGVGYLSRNQELFRKMRGTGWNPVNEEELLEVLGTAMLAGGATGEAKPTTVEDALAPIVNRSTILIGVSPKESANSGSRLSKDARMAAYLHGSKQAANSANNDTLQAFLASAKNNPARYREEDAPGILAHEIGKRLFALLLKPDDEPNVALGLAELGLDSLIAVEMRSWFKQVFALDISVLEMLAMGTLEALGNKVASKLADTH
jgi:acyl carrier protein